MYGTAVSWKSMLQTVVALSTTEAEYIAITEGVKESIWMQGFVKDIEVEEKSVVILYDSQSAVHLSKHHVFHEHHNTRYKALFCQKCNRIRDSICKKK